LTIFGMLRAEDVAGAPSRPGAPEGTPAALPSMRGLTLGLLGPSPLEPPRKERRRARRVQPPTAVEVKVIPHGAILVQDISPVGMLVEYEQAFKYGDIYQAELGRDDQQVRVRLQVIRSTVVRAKDRDTGVSTIRYRTGFQFVEPIPPGLSAIVAELTDTP
jgi:hypothetical protein